MMQLIKKLLYKNNQGQVSLVRAGLSPIMRSYTHRETLIKKEGADFVKALEQVGLPVRDDIGPAEVPFPEGIGLKEMGSSILEREKALHAITGKVSGGYYALYSNPQVNSSSDISWVKDNWQFFEAFRDCFNDGIFQVKKDIGFSAELDDEGNPYFGGHLLLSASVVLDRTSPSGVLRRLRNYEPHFRRPHNRRRVNEAEFLPILRSIDYKISKSVYERNIMMDPFGSYSHWDNINYSAGRYGKMSLKMYEEIVSDF